MRHVILTYIVMMVMVLSLTARVLYSTVQNPTPVNVILSIYLLFALPFCLFYPPAMVVVLSAGVPLAIIVLIAEQIIKRRRHHAELMDRVRRLRRALVEHPEDTDRREDLYQALRELDKPREMLGVLEAWAEFAPDDPSVKRRLREVRERLGRPSPQ